MTSAKRIRLPVALSVALVVACWGIPPQAFGGHGGGHGAGHHGGHHHGFHPYHPSPHHHRHHVHHDHRHTHHHDHYHHHHHSWHQGGWGPFVGGLGLGYGLGWGWNNWGWGGYGYGPGYVDNSVSNTYPVATDNPDAGDTSTPGDNQQTASDQPAETDGFPVDVWPALGINTYAGQYGKRQGLVVVSVQPGSAAQKAGLVPGDVIQKFNGQPIVNADNLESSLSAAQGAFNADVWDVRTGRHSTLSGTLDQTGGPPVPATGQTPAGSN